jgi:hypothetical protein
MFETAEESRVSEDVLRLRIEKLKLESVANYFIHARQWPLHLTHEVELEYRRFLFLFSIYGSQTGAPSGLIEMFYRNHLEQFVGRTELADAPPSKNGALVGCSVNEKLYRDIFGRSVPSYWHSIDISPYLDAASPS